MARSTGSGTPPCATAATSTTGWLRMVVRLQRHDFRPCNHRIGLHRRRTTMAVMRAATHCGVGNICQLQANEQDQRDDRSNTVHAVSIGGLS